MGTGDDGEGTRGNFVGGRKCSVITMIGVGLHRCTHVSNLSECTTKMCAHNTVCKFYIKRKKLLRNNEL